MTAPNDEFCRQRRAEFFDNRHLLKRERALKELPAVQAAAEDKCPFEQCAGVAENLENFVLCHAGGVSSFRFEVSR